MTNHRKLELIINLLNSGQHITVDNKRYAIIDDKLVYQYIKLNNSLNGVPSVVEADKQEWTVINFSFAEFVSTICDCFTEQEITSEL